MTRYPACRISFSLEDVAAKASASPPLSTSSVWRSMKAPGAQRPDSSDRKKRGSYLAASSSAEARFASDGPRVSFRLSSTAERSIRRGSTRPSTSETLGRFQDWG